MASESKKAEQPVFCQHILKPVPEEQEAYRCSRCGQVGVLVDQQIVWRAKQPNLVQRNVASIKSRQGKAVALVLAAVVTAAVVMTSTAATMNWRAGEAVQPLEPIPGAVEDGCCGPSEARGICCVEMTYDWVDPRTGQTITFTVVDCELCEGATQVCVVAGVWQTGNGHWGIRADCRNVQTMRRFI